VHWHMVLWVKDGMTPKHGVMEMPRGPDAAYLRQIVEAMQVH